MAASMKIRAFWDAAPCSLGVDRYFKGKYCLQHHSLPWQWRQYIPLKHWSTPMRLHDAASQKSLIFILLSYCLGYYHIVFEIHFYNFLVWLDGKVNVSRCSHTTKQRFCSLQFPITCVERFCSKNLRENVSCFTDIHWNVWIGKFTDTLHKIILNSSNCWCVSPKPYETGSPHLD
jgi:hypothetical protein